MAWVRRTTIPNSILIHPTVWQLYTNVADRQHRQRSDRQGEPFTLYNVAAVRSTAALLLPIDVLPSSDTPVKQSVNINTGER